MDATTFLDALPADGPILVTGPIGPDGDSMGGCLALQRVLRARGRDVDVAAHVPWRYRWLPGADAVVPDNQLRREYPTAIVVDGDRHRLTPDVDARYRAATVQAILDHHGSTRPAEYHVAWVEPAASSACEMIYRALQGWGVPLDVDLATALYTGIVFDTGGFRHSNTTPDVLRIAAGLVELGVDHTQVVSRILHERSFQGMQLAGRILSSATLHCDGALCVAGVVGLHGADLEGIVESLMQVVGVEVGALLTERSGGRVKISLRSRGRVDVAALAARIAPTGGGHRKAAGAVVQGGLAAATTILEAAVADDLRDP